MHDRKKTKYFRQKKAYELILNTVDLSIYDSSEQ